MARFQGARWPRKYRGIISHESVRVGANSPPPVKRATFSFTCTARKSRPPRSMAAAYHPPVTSSATVAAGHDQSAYSLRGSRREKKKAIATSAGGTGPAGPFVGAAAVAGSPQRGGPRGAARNNHQAKDAIAPATHAANSMSTRASVAERQNPQVEKRMMTASHAAQRLPSRTPTAKVSTTITHAASVDGRRTAASDQPVARTRAAASQ